jgi:hypothetical protein
MVSNPDPSIVAQVEATNRRVRQAAVKDKWAREIAEQTREAIRQSRVLLQRVERMVQALGPQGT